MANTLTAVLQAVFGSNLKKDLVLRDPVDPLSFRPQLKLEYGTGAGKANMHWGAERSLAAGANESLDLVGATTDEAGNVLSVQKVKGFIVVNTGVPGTHGDILVGGDGSAPWEGAGSFFAAAGSKNRLKAGAAMVVLTGETDADGYAVTPTTGDLLKVENESGSLPAKYQFGVIGES